MAVALASPPEQGQLVTVRRRQYVVTEVTRSASALGPIVPSIELAEQTKDHGSQGNRMRYRADLTAGAIKLRESRVIADLLLRETDAAAWWESIIEANVLQARSPASATRLTTLIRGRLETMGPDLWVLVRDGSAAIATHAVLAAAIKHSALLGDFLDLVVREQYRLYKVALSHGLWEDYLDDCRARDPEMLDWHESTRRRLRSSVFQILAQAGYLENTRTLKLQTAYVSGEVIRYLEDNDERYVLRCNRVAP